MSAKHTIKTRCPVCQSKYRLPSKSIGHRARCKKCQSVFRVADLNHTPTHKRRVPTEAEILAWLNEGDEDQEIAVRPRMKEQPPSLVSESTEEIQQATVPAVDDGTSELLSTDRLAAVGPDFPAKEISFRKTG